VSSWCALLVALKRVMTCLYKPVDRTAAVNALVARTRCRRGVDHVLSNQGARDGVVLLAIQLDQMCVTHGRFFTLLFL